MKKQNKIKEFSIYQYILLNIEYRIQFYVIKSYMNSNLFTDFLRVCDCVCVCVCVYDIINSYMIEILLT